ncbi:MAG: hypothetical protein LBS54_03335 [Dysgonamonadaceae bacterium]|jgi:hypothetical protein|nr:hypothetical protein [Dysgonamonadaceae bacterium]
MHKYFKFLFCCFHFELTPARDSSMSAVYRGVSLKIGGIHPFYTKVSHKRAGNFPACAGESFKQIDAIKVAQGVPSVAQGVPSVTQGVPSVAQGVPSVAQGVPSVTQGVPSIAQGVPSVTQGVPSVTQGVPLVTQGVPSVAQGVPSVTQGVPSVTQGVPSITEKKDVSYIILYNKKIYSYVFT